MQEENMIFMNTIMIFIATNNGNGLLVGIKFLGSIDGKLKSYLQWPNEDSPKEPTKMKTRGRQNEMRICITSLKIRRYPNMSWSCKQFTYYLNSDIFVGI